MIRILFLIVVVALVSAGGMWLADRPGAVTLNWQGWRVDTSVAFLALAVAIVAVLAAVLYRAWLALRRAPRSFIQSRRVARRERGYRALTQGMVAVAAGDPAEALRQARRADMLLGDPPLTMLLSAQAAQLSGDEAAARDYFSAMLKRPETAFLGLRGLIIQAQKKGDRIEALALVKRAYELRPKTPWVVASMFDLQVKEGRWREALATLDEAIRREAMPVPEARGRRPAVLLGCSTEVEAAGDRAAAMVYARKAYSLAPDFVPATLRLVNLLTVQGKVRPAARIIHNSWARTPHPELARIYDAGVPDDDPMRRLCRYERLAGFNPTHRETHLMLAEAALPAKLWGTARKHLEEAARDWTTPRLCRLMAELEEGEKGDTTAARQWLLKASNAEPDPAWLCTDCRAVSEIWTPCCARCGALSTIEWLAPDSDRALVFRPVVGVLTAEPSGDANTALGAHALVIPSPPGSGSNGGARR